MLAEKLQAQNCRCRDASIASTHTTFSCCTDGVCELVALRKTNSHRHLVEGRMREFGPQGLLKERKRQWEERCRVIRGRCWRVVALCGGRRPVQRLVPCRRCFARKICTQSQPGR